MESNSDLAIGDQTVILQQSDPVIRALSALWKEMDLQGRSWADLVEEEELERGVPLAPVVKYTRKEPVVSVPARQTVRKRTRPAKPEQSSCLSWEQAFALQKQHQVDLMAKTLWNPESLQLQARGWVFVTVLKPQDEPEGGWRLDCRLHTIVTVPNKYQDKLLFSKQLDSDQRHTHHDNLHCKHQQRSNTLVQPARNNRVEQHYNQHQ